MAGNCKPIDNRENNITSTFSAIYYAKPLMLTHATAYMRGKVSSV